MTNCGYWAQNADWGWGSVSGNTCTAASGTNAFGIWGYPYCCTITGGGSCVDASNGQCSSGYSLAGPTRCCKGNSQTLTCTTASITATGQSTSAYCPSGYTVTGCSATSSPGNIELCLLFYTN